MNLILNLKGIYFDQIKSGEKRYEYRLFNDYWKKRLFNRGYEKVIIRKGYPKKGDTEREIVFPWSGYEEQVITHPHFGEDPAHVFAIKLIPFAED